MICRCPACVARRERRKNATLAGLTIVAVLIVLFLSFGCATVPTGPSTQGIYAPETQYPKPR